MSVAVAVPSVISDSGVLTAVASNETLSGSITVGRVVSLKVII